MKPYSASLRPDDACGQGPETGEHVLVQCPGFRCLAYRAGDGSWHSVFGSQSALEVIEVVSRIENGGPSIPQSIDALLEEADALPPTPRILPRLLGELSNPETDVSRVAELVAVDPVLTAKLLRMCNNAVFGISHPIDDVSEAVHRLGFHAVYRTVAVVSGSTCFKMKGGAAQEADRLWRHSVTTAFAAQFIAEDVGLDSSVLFTAGILHDLGKVVLAGLQKASHGLANGEALAWERQRYGFNHADVGGRILERWRFSDYLVRSVKYHHDPEAGGDIARLAACVSLADVLSHRVDAGNEPGECGSQARTAFQLLDISEDNIGLYDERVRENLQFVEGMCRA